MNLLADEGIDLPIVKRLRLDGHEVISIAEQSPGVDDDTVLRRANSTRSLLLTLDKDFGELVFRRGLIHAGVILIRLSGLEARTKAEVVAAALREHGDELFTAFSVISPGTIRIRKKR
jgi:predicted nuclease of predicted toxin-antitoxin system